MKVSSEEALRHRDEILSRTKVGLPGLVRASFGCHNTVDEVDHLADIPACTAVGDVLGVYDQDPESDEFWRRGQEPDCQRCFTLAPGLSARDRSLSGFKQN